MAIGSTPIFWTIMLDDVVRPVREDGRLSGCSQRHLAATVQISNVLSPLHICNGSYRKGHIVRVIIIGRYVGSVIHPKFRP